ncbi:MAG: UbiD family decarboxylase [Acidobacteria bacterium]|nr:UbiD family decarboxylase [Acidobacteriota bacterium]
MATQVKDLKPVKGGYDLRAVKDLNDWIALLKSEGEYREIHAKVDWDVEIGTIARYCQSAQNGPALLFDNIKEHENTWCRKLFANSVASYGRMALAFGLPKDIDHRDRVIAMRDAYKKRLAPKEVSTAPFKRNVLRGDDVDITQIPVPKWHHWDGGRYINTFAPVITQDPESGQFNMGIYRGMVADKNHISCLLAPSQGWGGHFTKLRARQEPMKVACIYGCNALLTILAASAFGRMVPEYDVYGGIVGEPLELVKCETSDLLVPASAQMVIEGTMSSDPKDFMMEGPFAEHCGYYGGAYSRKPTIKVDAITFRDDPIYQGCCESIRPGWPTEDAYITSLSSSALVWNWLEQAGVPGVTDVWMNLDGTYFMIYVQIRQSYRHQAKQVASAIWGMSFGNWAFKNVMVVEEDIDIRDPGQLEWAFCTRVNSAMGDIVIFENHFGSVLDPSTPLEERDLGKYGTGKWARVLIDATRNWDLGFRPFWNNQVFPPVVVLSREDEDLVRRRWDEYGLGDIQYIPRMKIDTDEDLKWRYSLQARPTPEYLSEEDKKG